MTIYQNLIICHRARKSVFGNGKDVFGLRTDQLGGSYPIYRWTSPLLDANDFKNRCLSIPNLYSEEPIIALLRMVSILESVFLSKVVSTLTCDHGFTFFSPSSLRLSRPSYRKSFSHNISRLQLSDIQFRTLYAHHDGPNERRRAIKK